MGAIALISIQTACARAHRPAQPTPGEAELAETPREEVSVGISEEEVRAFLAAEEEERRAEREADLVVEDEEEIDDEGGPIPSFDPADFDLPITINERVEYWIDYFRGRSRDRFEIFLTRMGRYEGMIRNELRSRGMPEDLIYLALIESGFSPTAISSARAVGVWQFMAPTARQYQLEVSHYIDERRDPIRATSAALDYLEELYERFGSWYLAAASYNTGENRVGRLLNRHADGASGADSLFWTISPYLPSETRNYVPKLIAATILGTYRDHYEFDQIQPERPIPFEVVRIPDATELEIIARAAGVEKEEIETLNPHFVRGVTPPGREVDLRVPVGHRERFQIAYAKIPPEERVTRVEHIVQRGETLSHIARRYGTTVRAIQQTNQIRNANSIRIGQRLVVRYGGGSRTSRVAANTATKTNTTPAQKTRQSSGETTKRESVTTTYEVRRGDSLWTIARAHGVSIREIREWNGLGNSDRIVPGQELRIQREEKVIVYRVQPGDTIWEIARRHGIRPDHLIRWNQLSERATIRPGEKIEVPVVQ